MSYLGVKKSSENSGKTGNPIPGKKCNSNTEACGGQVAAPRFLDKPMFQGPSML